jgi:hypothetical protein
MPYKNSRLEVWLPMEGSVARRNAIIGRVEELALDVTVIFRRSFLLSLLEMPGGTFCCTGWR